jgi:hypothetical protein
LRDHTASETTEREKRKADLLSRLFTASLQTSNFDEAYSALTRLPSTGVRHFSLQSFITTLVAQKRVPLLLTYPFASLSKQADEVLASLAKKTLNMSVQPQYHKVLYAWRINKGDYRGAAQCAFDRLERLKTDSEVTRNPEDRRLVEGYLLLINTLVCVGKDEAWVIKESVNSDMSGQGKGKKAITNGFGAGAGSKRSIVTLDDVRREYQEELDRLAAMEQGQFAFAGGDGMDIL